MSVEVGGNLTLVLIVATCWAGVVLTGWINRKR